MDISLFSHIICTVYIYYHFVNALGVLSNRIDHIVHITAQQPLSFYQSLQLHQNILRSLQQHFPQISDMIYLKTIATTLNENIFARMRAIVATPDHLEFAISKFKVVDELMKQVSHLPFIYHTKGHSYYSLKFQNLSYKTHMKCLLMTCCCYKVSEETLSLMFGS